MTLFSKLFGLTLPVLGVASLALCAAIAGRNYSFAELIRLVQLASGLTGAIALVEILRQILRDRRGFRFRSNRLRLLSAVFIGISAAAIPLIADSLEALNLIAWSCGSLLVSSAIGFSGLVRITKSHWLSRQHPGIIGITSFAAAICLGALALRSPHAAANGESIDWDDAFFTSASAVCVTGLITLDTEHDFSRFGQAVILILIQAGGLGIITWAYLMAVALGESMSLRDRVILRDLLTQSTLASMKSRLTTIVALTLALETLGCILLYAFFHNEGDSQLDRWFTATFHSVSGYCNAGFSTFSQNLMDPRARQAPAAISIISLLVIIGGLGTPVWIDLIQKAKTWTSNARRSPSESGKRYFATLHSRIALTTTISLLLVGGVAIHLAKLASATATPSSWTVSLFDSITARTAGFNLENIADYSHSSLAAIMALMFIGGCPGGTAGGIKCTTFAVVLINLRQALRNSDHATIWGRRLPSIVTSQSLAIISLGAVWIATATVVIHWLHPNFEFADVLFESISAFGTVGLSRGITAELSTAAKWILIATMFVGRLGILLIFCSILPPRPASRISYPEEAPLLS